MKVLWFSNTPSNYSENGSAHNGNGWVSALETLVSPRVELAVVFLTKNPLKQAAGCSGKVGWTREEQHGVLYYPVYNGYDVSRSDRVKALFIGDGGQVSALLECYRDIIRDFSPDVIQFFGSEHSYGLVAASVDIPSVLHIQGLIRPCYEAYLPKGVSWRRWVTTPLKPLSVIHKLYTRKKWRAACRREKTILSTVRNFLGRTFWDYGQVKSVNPQCRYFHCDEVLRDDFYLGEKASGSGRFTIVTTISEPPYKGMDVLLRASRKLREAGLDFEWNVYGNVRTSFFEKVTGITSSEAGLSLRGVAGASEIASALREASVYVHPSYIDNSPNSVCEAQITGLPVVAAAVGGVPSLITEGVDGFLVEVGNADAVADAVLKLAGDANLRSSMGRNARAAALERHDRDKIVSDLMNAYNELIADGGIS